MSQKAQTLFSNKLKHRTSLVPIVLAADKQHLKCISLLILVLYCVCMRSQLTKTGKHFCEAPSKGCKPFFKD